jgi:hypothetical protein
MQNKNKVV